MSAPPQTPSTKGEYRMGRDHRITDWNPEDTAAWEAGNSRIARRNLLCTVAGAAFSRYVRQASDYAGGRQILPE